MAKQFYILCGVPGAGKSTYTQKLNLDTHRIHASADHYMVDANGEYKFDFRRLSYCHGQCLKAVVQGCVDKENIVVDNTNTTVAEIAPYAALALAYGYDLHIVWLKCDPKVAHARNVHGVSLSNVMAMHDRLMKLDEQLPPWWPFEIVEQ